MILAKTIKGYGMGTAGEGQNITHQQKKMNEEALLAFRDRFELELTDEQVRNLSFYKPPEGSPEAEFIREQRAKLGGSLPARRRKAESLPTPELSAFQSQLDGTGDREVSTTMSFVRILSTLLRDKQLGKRIVPIVPDESRTFGMEGLFRQLGIFSQLGQLYTPEDRDQLMFYREDKHGQVLQEGINEPGAMSSFIAAGTSYSNHAAPTIPFYIYYSMFGFQRIGDLAWAAGDSRTRGFMLGGTAGRTTLNGEGLQHEDGHSHLVSATIPNCVSYDPTYGYELAVIIREGLRRMFTEQEDVFYYLTLMNENYQHPAMPEGAEEGILRGLYKLAPAADGEAQIQLLGSGVILREVLAAQALLADDFGVAADVWSVPSFTELAREAQEVDRWNTFHPGEEAKTSWVQEQLGTADRPGRRVDGLHARLRGSDPSVRRPAVPRARHGRLRPQRLPQDAALVLRSGSPPRRAGGADRAGQDLGRYGTPDELARMARRFPELHVVVPHFGVQHVQDLLFAAWGCPNIHVDTSGSNQWVRWMPYKLTLEDLFRRCYETIGPQRIVYGSDSSWFPRGYVTRYLDDQLRVCRELGMPDDHLRAIFAGNAERLLGLTDRPAENPGPGPRAASRPGRK